MADLDGPWVLELHVADDRAGHVLAARADLQDDLGVTFKLASDPEHEYQGRIADVALATELDEAQDATLRVTVDFPRGDVPALRPAPRRSPRCIAGAARWATFGCTIYTTTCGPYGGNGDAPCNVCLDGWSPR